MLFHLSNAAMLPLAGAAVTMRAGHFANIIIAACIVVPQVIVALLSPWVGAPRQKFGRKRLLLLGWGALPLRGLLLAVLPGSWPLVAGPGDQRRQRGGLRRLCCRCSPPT